MTKSYSPLHVIMILIQKVSRTTSFRQDLQNCADIFITDMDRVFRLVDRWEGDKGAWRRSKIQNTEMVRMIMAIISKVEEHCILRLMLDDYLTETLMDGSDRIDIKSSVRCMHIDETLGDRRTSSDDFIRE